MVGLTVSWSKMRFWQDFREAIGHRASSAAAAAFVELDGTGAFTKILPEPKMRVLAVTCGLTQRWSIR
jgi:hypothetical protein